MSYSNICHLCECCALIGDKHPNLLRELQQRDCKDDGNNAGSIYLDRHVCTSAACLLSAYHLGGILHRQSSFTGVYTNNESKNNNQINRIAATFAAPAAPLPEVR